ncbi:MAG: IS6 family transposase, partial [Gammaproteobacteria bacterium]|nr:IS6 family transposase [Gammaproteobacteria bacterium]
QKVPNIPDEPDVLDAEYALQGLRVDAWRRVCRVRRVVCGFSKSVEQAQRFLSTHAAFYNLFNLGRHLVKAEHYRNLREGAFGRWAEAVA